MVRAILGLVLILFLMTPANAQEQKSADEIVQKMTTDLNLTPEQASAVKPIIEDNMAKRQELLNGTMDRSSIKDQMAQLRQEEEQKLGQVLNQDQMAKLTSLKEQRRGGAHQHHMRGAGDAPSGMGQ